MIVDENISLITQPDRRCHLPGKILCRGSGHRRRHIRPKHQRIALPVKELVEIPGRGRAHFLSENIKKLKGRSLNRMVTVFADLLIHPGENLQFSLTLAVVDIPNPLRCVQQLIFHISSHISFGNLL